VKGIISSTVVRSLENLFKMFPTKLVSKNTIEALRMLAVIFSCRLIEAFLANSTIDEAVPKCVRIMAAVRHV
jgi:hypothetical protein